MSADPVLDLIDRLYAAALEPDGWPAALEALAQAVGGVGAVIVPITSPTKLATITSPSLAEPNVAYEAYWWQHDTRVAHFRSQRAIPSIVTDAQAVTEDQVRRDPFYQEFLRPNGFGACMAQIVNPSPNYVMAVSIQRDGRLGGFEADEMQRFTLVGKHAARALTTTARLAEVNRTTRLLGTAMQHSRSGMLVLDGGGRVTHLNAVAEALLGDGLTVRGGRLQARTTDEQNRLDEMIHATLHDEGRAELAGPLATVAIRRRLRPLPLLVQAVPVRAPPDNAAWEAVILGPGALVLIHDPEAPPGPGAVDQLVLMGLTRGQARVADAVGAGMSVAEAALHLGLAESTVRVVLKAVYDKLNLSRQSQLAVLTTRLRSIQP